MWSDFGSSDPASKTGPATMVEYYIRKQKRNYVPLMILFISLIFGGRYKSWKLLVHWLCQRERYLLLLLYLWIMTISQDKAAGKLVLRHTRRISFLLSVDAFAGANSHQNRAKAYSIFLFHWVIIMPFKNLFRKSKFQMCLRHAYDGVCVWDWKRLIEDVWRKQNVRLGCQSKIKWHFHST